MLFGDGSRESVTLTTFEPSHCGMPAQLSGPQLNHLPTLLSLLRVASDQTPPCTDQ